MVIIPANIEEVLDCADIECIKSCHEDNGILRNYAENCEDVRLKEWAQHFIRVNEIEADNIMGEINDRRAEREVTELSRRRSGRIEPGNESGIEQQQEGDGKHQEQNSLAR